MKIKLIHMHKARIFNTFSRIPEIWRKVHENNGWKLMGEVGREDLHMERTDYVQNFRSEMICPNPRTSTYPGPGIILLAR